MGGLRKEVGALSGNLGALLEDLVQASLPAYLERAHSVIVSGRLETAFLAGPDGTEEEIDVYGDATGPSGPVAVVAEAKGRIYAREVQAFRDKVDCVKQRLGLSPFGVMVGYRVHPSARAVAERAGIVLVTTAELRAVARPAA